MWKNTTREKFNTDRSKWEQVVGGNILERKKAPGGKMYTRFMGPGEGKQNVKEGERRWTNKHVYLLNNDVEKA